MSVTAQRLRIEVEADTDPATRGLRDLETQGSRVPGWAKAAGAALAGAFAVDKIVDGVRAAVGAASSLEQSVGGVGAVFGEQRGVIDAWAGSAAKALGLSTNAYNEFATVVGSQLKNMGVPMADVTGLTNDLIGKGADLAATFGGETSEAVGALSALLRGESDPIERYGIAIKDADIQARLAADGLKGLEGEAGKAARTQAILALLTEQSAAAQGAFARESATFAGTQQRLTASWTNLTAIIGGAFLPAGTQVLDWAQTAVDWLSGRLPGAIESTRAALGDVGAALAGAFDGGAVSGALSGVLEPLRAMASNFVEPLLAAFRGLGPVLAPLGGQVMGALSAFSPLGLVFKALTPLLPQVGAMLGQVAGTLVSALGPALAAIVPALASMATTVGGALSGAFAALLPAIGSLLPLIGPLAQVIAGVLVTAVTALSPLITMLAGVFADLVPAVTPLIGAVVAVVSALAPVVAIVGDLIGALLPPLVDLFMALLGPILDLIAPLVGELAPILTTVADIIASLLVPIIGTLANWLGRLVAAIAPVVAAIVGGVVQALSSFIQWLVRGVSGIAQFVGDGIARFGEFARFVATAVGLAVSNVSEIPGKIGAVFSGAGTWLVESGRKIIQGLIDGVKGMASKVVDAVSGVLSKARDLLPFSPAKTGPFSGKGWTLYSGRSISAALAEGIMDNANMVSKATNAVAAAAALNLPGGSVGATSVAGAAYGPSSAPGGVSAADALGVGSALQVSGPSTLVIVDADGSLIGRMRVEAGRVASGSVTPLDEGRASW